MRTRFWVWPPVTIIAEADDVAPDELSKTTEAAPPKLLATSATAVRIRVTWPMGPVCPVPTTTMHKRQPSEDKRLKKRETALRNFQSFCQKVC